MSEKIRLDSTDFSIIKEVIKSGWRNSSELARKLNIPASTIRRRVARLINNDYIKVIAAFNPNKLKYDGWGYIGIKAEPGKAQEIAECIGELDEIDMVALSFGRYDVLVSAYKPTVRDLMDFVNNHIHSIPGVLNTETSLISFPTKIWYTKWKP